MSQRTERVESLVQQIVAESLPELLGPEVAKITVTGVDVSPDLRSATVWIGVVAGEAEETMKSVEAQRSQLQKIVSGRLTTKYVPRITLKLDTGGQYAEHITDLLKGL
jgi:ribosome-binding factor A